MPTEHGTFAESDRDRRFAALTAAAQAGDKAAYSELLRTAVGPIQAVVRRAGVPAAGVDDVVQEVLISVHSHLHTFDIRRPFAPWLAAIARRRAVDFLRRHGRQAAREIHAPLAYAVHADETDPGAAAERQSEAAALHRAIATLPDRQREAVEVLAIADRAPDEAATLTGTSAGALRVNLHRALRNLRARLGAGG